MVNYFSFFPDYLLSLPGLIKKGHFVLFLYITPCVFIFLFPPAALYAQSDSILLNQQVDTTTHLSPHNTSPSPDLKENQSNHEISADTFIPVEEKKNHSLPRVALVLSGGGARGLAQVGVLKAIEEAGIKPAIIVASSMGAIIGSMYASGISITAIDSIMKSINWDALFSNKARRRNLPVSVKNEPINYLFEIRFASDLMPILPNSISHGQAIYDLLSPILTAPLYQAKLNFDSLFIPLRIVTTDILSGRSVIFSKGDLLKAIRASCGVPLAFSPVEADSMLLLDGGLTANIPVEAARKENPDYIIAVDVTSPMWKKEDLNNPIHLFDQIIAIGIDKQKKEQRKLADIIISPNLEGFLNTDFSQPDSMINLGYAAAIEKIPFIKEKLSELRTKHPSSLSHSPEKGTLPLFFKAKGEFKSNDLDSLISELNKKGIIAGTEEELYSALIPYFNAFNMEFAGVEMIQRKDSADLVLIDPGPVDSIMTEGNSRTSSRLIKTASGLRKGSLLNQKMIKNAVTALYATNLFYNVNIIVDSLRILHIKVVEKEYWRARLGLRFDEYHLLEGFIQPAYENLFGSAFCASIHLQYGKMREKYTFELAANRSWSLHWANYICFQGFISRERIINETTYPDTVDTVNNNIIIDKIIEYDEKTLRKIGFLGRIGTQLGTIAMLDGTIRFEKFSVTRSEKSAVADLLGPAFKYGLRYLMVRLTIDDLDRFPFPKKGQKHYISIGGATDIIGGTESFLNLHGSLRYYFTFRKKHTCSPLIVFSWSNKTLPPVEQVYLGGSVPDEKYQDAGVYNYIPFVGLKPRALAGDIMVLLHGQYRFAFTKRFFLITLGDWGYTWNEPDFEFNRKTAEYFLSNALVGVGLGLGLETPVGPIKLSWGRIVRGSLKKDFDINIRNVIYFSAGHDF